MQDFEGKVAVVTGAANPLGIGYATCRLFAEVGCRVVLTDLDGDGAEARATELRAAGADVVAVATDMADRDAVERLAATTYARYGAAHIVLLNHVAPTGRAGHGLLNPDPEAWVLHTNVNLLGCVYGIKAFVPRMIEGGQHGHILATTSGAGATGTMYGNGPYAVTKAAITSLMECLYGQLRDAGADVVAGLVFPSVTSTHGPIEVGERTVAMLRAGGVPVRLMRPEEVAEFTLDAIRRDTFWAQPDPDDERNREIAGWQAGIYRLRSEAIVNRTPPDTYLWGPPSDLLGP
jgi:NAD(P)-dependent dehydrogenase (short-subunit alcohol dehydrogenase family)